jgi:hypothetical protein
MSWLSKATGIHWGNIGAPVGAAIGSIIPGVGTAIGAGLGQALGSVGQGHSVGQAALEGAGAGAGAYGLGKLGSALGGMGKAGGGISDASVGGDGGGDWLSSAGGFLKDHLGSLASSAFGGSGGSDGGGGLSPAVLALAGLQTANAANLGKTANDYSNKAWSGANDSYTQRAGLRTQGINQMLHPTVPNTANLGAIRGSNPYAQPPTPPPTAQSPLPLAGTG